MARKRRSSRSSSPPPVSLKQPHYVRSESRDAIVIANLRSAPAPRLIFQSPPRSVRPLLAIEDRRTFHPEPYTRPAAMFTRPRHRLQMAMGAKRPATAPAKRGYAVAPDYRVALPHQIRFKGANSVLVCVRRNQRREALFALKKAGKGRSTRVARKWSSYSKISCKR